MMDKAKAYDEALERARKQKDDYQKELDKTDKNSQLASILKAGISAIEMVFPQLKDSDDERIRKDIIDHFESIKSQALYDNQEESDNIISSCNEKIAYLEKQKEPVPIPNKFSGLKSLMLQYLQSAANRKDDSEIESDTDLWGRKILDYVWKHSDEQKPIEPECPQFVFDDILALECAMGIVYRKGDEQKLYEALRSLHSRLHDMIDAQKEQEFTPNTYGCLNCTKLEECEKGLTPCSGHRLKIIDQKPADDKAFEEWIDSWFKEHKEKAYPQITMDEKEFKNFCRGIRNMYQQKSDWNEEDEEIWFALITFFKTYLQKYPPACKDEKIQANRILKWLNTTIKSFRLHYRWKPSKEKMDALKNVAYGTYQNGDGPALRELYKQLLKLGVKEEPEYYQHFDPDC